MLAMGATVTQLPQCSPGRGYRSYQHLPAGPSGRTVNQYGVDYIRFTCSGSYTIDFTGSTLTRLLPADPHSGSYSFWSNKGNVSEMTLTHQFDLTGVSSPVTFSLLDLVRPRKGL